MSDQNVQRRIRLVKRKKVLPSAMSPNHSERERVTNLLATPQGQQYSHLSAITDSHLFSPFEHKGHITSMWKPPPLMPFKYRSAEHTDTNGNLRNSLYDM
ncbi:hypothetical protein IRJ41_004612 [Triplophysa rosa]|uniref:Uncharacterized protein n=1 Tax=Triplophysa rosa TaxID=992332 RepID=A0A9W7WYQ5_TRIRA|nr:hypothetical protein IRJ41_004612 [Triplophysa rosa]